MSTDYSLVAVWEVGAQTYTELVHEAITDARAFMIAVDADHEWTVRVLNCQPHEYDKEHGTVSKWKGQAVLQWVDTSCIPMYHYAPNALRDLDHL